MVVFLQTCSLTHSQVSNRQVAAVAPSPRFSHHLTVTLLHHASCVTPQVSLPSMPGAATLVRATQSSSPTGINHKISPQALLVGKGPANQTQMLLRAQMVKEPASVPALI